MEQSEAESSSISTEIINNDPNRYLFSNVRYFLINTQSEIEDLLKLNGAKEDKYLSSFITHVICDNSADNSDCFEAKEVFDLPIVKSEWVKQCLALNTILPAEAFSSDSNRLFSQIKAVNLNLNINNAKPLMSMINYYGGQTFNELNDQCTHIFAIEYDNLANQLENFEIKKFKLVTPDWITDCIEQNKIIDELIYNPKFLTTNPENKDIQTKQRTVTPEPVPQQTLAPYIVFKSQLILNELVLFENDAAKSTPSPTSIKLVTKPDNSNLNRVIMQQQSELIDSSNDLSRSLSASSIQAQLENTIRFNSNQPILIQQGMPVIQTLVPISTDQSNSNNTSLNITPPNKAKFKRPRKTSSGISPTGNSQPANIIQPINSTFTSEMDEIFQSVISSVTSEDKLKKAETNIETNKVQSAQPIYLNLIKQNVQFDDDLTSQQDDTYFVQENSHLIQFDRCLLGCVFYIKASDVIYTAECLLDWKNVIDRYGGRTVDEYESNSNEITHVLVPNRFCSIYKRAFNEKKRLVTAYWLEDVLQEQKLRPPWLAYHFPSPYEIKTGPLTNHIVSTSGFSGKEKLIIKTLIWLLNGKYSSYLSNITSLLISKSNDDLAKYEKAKKWNINIVNGCWLMELYLGNTLALNKQIEERYTNLNVNHFSYDNQFVIEFMDAWKTLIKLPIETIKEANQLNAPLKQLNRSPLKRRNCSRSSSPTNANFKMKKDCNSITWIKAQSSVPIVMFTGFNTDDLVQYQKDIVNLNGIVSKQFNQTTHLVVDKIERTAKLLKCISTCEYIVHIGWLIDSKIEGKFKDPLDYQVKDDQFERHYSCCLKESLDRARERKPLFSGLMFYLSPSVRPSYKDIEEMIKSAGGIVLRDVPKLINFNEPFCDEYNSGLTSKYVVIGSQNDLCILRPFIEKKIPIYHEELVLSGLLRQKIEPNINKFYLEY